MFPFRRHRKNHFKRIPNPPIFDNQGLFIFYPNNKCGQTSITGGSAGQNTKAALAGRCVVKKADSKTWEKYAKKKWKKALKFTIVRHPYSRFESTYRYLKKFYEYKEIETFLMEIEQRGFFDEHLQPQWTSAFDERGKQIVDYILRIENINNDWSMIKDQIKAGEIPQLNITQDKINDNELKKEHKERIYNLYELDFIRFSYKK